MKDFVSRGHDPRKNLNNFDNNQSESNKSVVALKKGRQSSTGNANNQSVQTKVNEEEETGVQMKEDPIATFFSIKDAEQNSNKPNANNNVAQAKMEEEENLQLKKDEDEEILQRKSMNEEEPLQAKKGEEEEIQMKASTSSAKMPEGVQAKMENSFGTDFSGVNIHTNSDNATNIGALAYTQGSDIHFAPGQYNPQSQGGQELLGHELTHVVQQGQGNVQSTTQMKGVNVNDDTGLEKEADVMGKKAANGESVNVKNSTSVGSVQKSGDKRIATNNIKVGDTNQSNGDPGTVEFINVPAGIQGNLKNVVGQLRSKTTNDFKGGSHDVLDPGHSILLSIEDTKLDISKLTAEEKTKFKGRSVFSFTMIQTVASNPNAVKTKVEYKGPDKLPSRGPNTTDQLVDKKFEKYFSKGLGWNSEDEFKIVKNTIFRMPDSILSKISNIKFNREAKYVGDDPDHSEEETAALYTLKEDLSHTITVYDIAFVKGDTRFGDSQTGFSTVLEQSIIHEVGHAIDKASLRNEGLNQEAAINKYNNQVPLYNANQNSYNKEFDALKVKYGAYYNAKTKTFNFPNVAKQNEYTADYNKIMNKVNNSQKTLDDLKNASIMAQNKYVDARGYSGEGWIDNNGKDKIAPVVDDTAFHKAIIADGGGKITDYSAKDYQEYFAEAFSMYFVDPQRLKLLKLNVYNYFVAKFPKV